MSNQKITIKKYLINKGIVFKENNGELITNCLFNGCDKDSRQSEAHLYFNAGDKKITYPKGIEAEIYDWNILDNATDGIVICEGELDQLLLLSRGIPSITSTHGAMTFKQEWIEKIKKINKIYICFDKDITGKKGAERIAKMLWDCGHTGIYIITLPDEVGEKGDITDYFIKLNGNVDDLFSRFAKEYPEWIDIYQFKPLSSHDLLDILGLTIKKDEKIKLLLFCVNYLFILKTHNLI